MSRVRLTDAEIEKLVCEPKSLAPNYEASFVTVTKPDEEERMLEVVGTKGTRFRVILRQNMKRTTDFSAVLGCRPTEDAPLFLLRRYNGDTHPHKNRLEGDSVSFCFHIHEATERYQAAGEKEDGYAARTDRYHDLSSAFNCLLEDCAFEGAGDHRFDLDSVLLEGDNP